MPDGAACGVSGMKVIGLHDVVKRVGQEKVTAVSRLSLEVCRGEIVSILGPSGCGKTTTLRLMAGLERPDSGRIVINGRVVASDGGFVPPERRNVGIVLQGFALFPHLTVRQNIPTKPASAASSNSKPRRGASHSAKNDTSLTD